MLNIKQNKKRIKFLSLKKTNGRIFLKRELKKSAKQEKKKKGQKRNANTMAYNKYTNMRQEA